MATNLQFIPGRKQGSENPILNGFRYVFDKRSNDTSYWKCSEFRKGCRARIRTVDRQLITPTPDHTHPVHHAETTVHVSKQNLKRKASGGDQPTKYLVSEAVGGLGYESRAKLGCQLSSLNRMVQRSRKAANRHPSNPRDLETLSIPANYSLDHVSNWKCVVLKSGHNFGQMSFFSGTLIRTDVAFGQMSLSDRSRVTRGGSGHAAF